jgi:hypothetical protein
LLVGLVGPVLENSTFEIEEAVIHLPHLSVYPALERPKRTERRASDSHTPAATFDLLHLPASP